MSRIICTCVDDLFNISDYNNLPINHKLLKNHNKEDNAWISIDNNVYSIRKNDYELLNIFKDYYGKNIKNEMLKNYFLNLKDKIIFLDKLNKRKIGHLID